MVDEQKDQEILDSIIEKWMIGKSVGEVLSMGFSITRNSCRKTVFFNRCGWLVEVDNQDIIQKVVGRG